MITARARDAPGAVRREGRLERMARGRAYERAALVAEEVRELPRVPGQERRASENHSSRVHVTATKPRG